MLSFYFDISGSAQPAIEENLVCELSLEDVQLFSKFKVIKEFENGRYNPQDVQCLPYFDDFRLTLSVIKVMLERCKAHAESLRATPGFKFPALDSYEQMLAKALDSQCELVAYCD